ncbi:ectonucleotide pyrophosphatase/phosphodiesterase [Rhodohalobacter mucosus]|uniref:Alkaline phosphatase family protein n=1 Tax=Rhodohalobacter mucosus TaxID=2079485 RepID=A0A316TP66_9BACT|nr:ectonucleotide pyrophosphatase/phosphodiesterase [Rhodohalobacter mucosus]PWN05588.1 alkaline phosphatase family protein [Rhodohalobacter mucosus]
MNKSPVSLFLLSVITGILFIQACTTPERQAFEDQKVLLISIDGFMPDYFTDFDTPALDRLASSGVLADHMIPVFPTKTFPNHYSIVTGLYTENTGVIANNMYDPVMDARFSLGNRDAVSNGEWYGGEPIWVTAETQGVSTATMFWPGSEAEINGVRPTRWMPYDDDMPYKARVDTIVSWLQVDDDTEPRFLTLYFSKVDSYGHRYGTESDSVRAAVREVDGHIGYLLDEIERIGADDELNIIITSDHGMADLSSDRVIVLDDIIDMDKVNVIDWTPVAMIQPLEGEKENVYQQLKEAENNYSVYKKEEIPAVYHIKNSIRVPEIMMIADVGYTITTNEYMVTRDITGATHGYDHRAPEMRSFFLAFGPALRQGFVSGPFQSIHLYDMMAHLLDVNPAPNDGSLDSLRHVLREP